MELAVASTAATRCLPSTGFARVVASKTISSANCSANWLCDWSAKLRHHPSVVGACVIVCSKSSLVRTSLSNVRDAYRLDVPGTRRKAQSRRQRLDVASHLRVGDVSVLSSQAVPASLLATGTRVQGLFGTMRYRDDIGRGHRPRDTDLRQTCPGARVRRKVVSPRTTVIYRGSVEPRRSRSRRMSTEIRLLR